MRCPVVHRHRALPSAPLHGTRKRRHWPAAVALVGRSGSGRPGPSSATRVFEPERVVYRATTRRLAPGLLATTGPIHSFGGGSPDRPVGAAGGRATGSQPVAAAPAG